MAIWYILWLHICYIFSRFGMLYQEKSGNPDQKDGGFVISSGSRFDLKVLLIL
jgi:hypothetical protein